MTSLTPPITTPITTAGLRWRSITASALLDDAALRADWDRLNAARGDLPVLSAATVGCALRSFGTGGERLAIAEHADAAPRTVAMFLMQPQGRQRWDTFHPMQMPLGAWVSDASLDVGDLGRSLLHGPLGMCLVVSLTQLDPRHAPRPEPAPDALPIDYVPTAWIDIAGGFDAYWAARGKNLRQNMRKQRNKLAAEGTALQLRTVTEPGAMAGVIQRYGELESRGWKADGGTAIHLDNPQGAYYARLFGEAAAVGEAVAYEYLFGERTVAVNLCIRRHGVLVVLKTTYDESIRNCSPAFLLNEDMLKQLFADGDIRRLEFYGRLMEWHTRWTDNSCQLYHVSLYRWPFLKSLSKHVGDRKRRQAEQLAAEPAKAEPVKVDGAKAESAEAAS